MLTVHQNRIRYTTDEEEIRELGDDAILPINPFPDLDDDSQTRTVADDLIVFSEETGDTDANEESNGATAASSSCLSGFASFLSLSVVMYAGMWYGPV